MEEVPPGYVCHKCKVPGHHISQCPQRSHRQAVRHRVPPPGYLCKRCNTPGHLIQDCPLNTYLGPPAGYICKKCNVPGHFIKDCPLNSIIPPGYVCNKCGISGHLIKDCPLNKVPPPDYVCHRCGIKGHLIKDCPQNRGAVPPPGYICRKCSVPGHFIQDCPLSDGPSAVPGAGGAGGGLPPLHNPYGVNPFANFGTSLGPAGGNIPGLPAVGGGSLGGSQPFLATPGAGPPPPRVPAVSVSAFLGPSSSGRKLPSQGDDMGGHGGSH